MFPHITGLLAASNGQKPTRYVVGWDRGDWRNTTRLARTIHEYLLRHPILLPSGFFSFGLLDGLQVRLRRPYLRETPAGFGLERLATAFMNNPG
jgi:hypothetical protein